MSPSLKYQITVASFDAMLELSEVVAPFLPRPCLVLLEGEMGAGKTTFAQGLGAGLGVEKRITSPTFLTAKQYELESGKLIHCDLYRVESTSYLEEIGVMDSLLGDAVVLVEWPKIEEKLLESFAPWILRVGISVDYDNGEVRVVSFQASGFPTAAGEGVKGLDQSLVMKDLFDELSERYPTGGDVE